MAKRNVTLPKWQADIVLTYCKVGNIPILNTGADGNDKYIELDVTFAQESKVNQLIDNLTPWTCAEDYNAFIHGQPW